MKSISEYLIEQLNEAEDRVIDSSVDDSKDDAASSVDDSADDQVKEADETIKDEKDFRAAAEAKFKTVFGDDLDKERMDNTIDGILDDHKDLVEKGDWGELIGILNKSFGHN